MLTMSMACVSVAMLSIVTESPQWLVGLLVCQTMMIVTYVGLVKLSLCYSYILFLVFLGGLLVMFTYVVSLSANFKLTYLSKFSGVSGLSVSLSMTMGIMVFWDSLGGSSESSLEEESGMYLVKNLYNYNSSYMYMYTMMFLLLALLCVAWMVKYNSGPLRLME